MKALKKYFGLIVVVTVLFAGCSSKTASKTPIENLYEYHLDNGLTLFVAENHSVPLTYVEIAVKAGAVAQTPETAGLFHLYEHMMFKGNSLYKDAASVQKALSDMGVSSWNGTTGTDCVNYFFTIPSDQTENGLAFWNAAIRSPSMDSKEFEGEKKVVLSEIEGDCANPDEIFYNYTNKELFHDAPYRVDAGGSYEVIKDATVDQMRYIQNNYYIPCNSSLYVGGDVNPDEVYKMVNKIYGSWSNGGKEKPESAPQQDTDPFAETEYLVMPYENLGPGYAMTYVQWRGPDTDFEIEDTYASDYLCQLISDPSGTFKQSLSSDPELGIPTTDYVDGGYLTQRASGTYEFMAYMLQPQVNLASRAKYFEEKIQNEVLPSIAEDASLYDEDTVSQISEKLKTSDIFSSETATGLLSTLRFWWCCSSPEYYYTYNDRLASIKQGDMQELVAKYITGKGALVTVLVNPDVYEATKDEYKALGYKVIDGEESSWWKDPRFAVNEDVRKAQTGSAPEEKIYVPSDKAGKDAKISEPVIKTYKLSNGIPVYVENNKGAKVDSVSVCLKGGTSHLTFETAGLEKALFNMMSQTSQNYDYDTRNYEEYVTGSSIGASSYLPGSYLSLTSLDKDLYDMLDVMTDGIVNPDFNEELFDYMKNDYEQALESTFTDPQSYLSYELLQTIYKDHPYRIRTSANPSSIDNITLEGLQELYGRIITADDMYVVAVGAMDGKELVDALNKTLGTIEAKGSAVPEAGEIADVKVKGEPVLLTLDSAAGAGFVARAVSVPSVSDKDYMAARLATNMYDSVMFNVVREHYGDCYTPYTVLSSMNHANFAYEFLYKATDYENMAKDMEEARNYMAQGKLIESVDENGEYVTSDIASRLQSYKNSYINATYEESATSAGVCGNLTYNVMMYGDIAFDTKQTNELLKASAEDVLDAFNRYYMTDDYRWFAVVGPEVLESVKLD